MTVTGTATDTGGGTVGGVEVSTDGGTSLAPGVRARHLEPTPGCPTTVGHGDDQGPGHRRQREHRAPRPRDVTVTGTRGRARARSGRTATTPSDAERHRPSADRARREVPGRHARHHHRPALLQGRRQHRHPRRPPLDLDGNAARLGDVHRRDRLRLAAGQLRPPVAVAPTPPTWRPTTPTRVTTPTMTTSSPHRRRQRAAARARGRDRRPERRLRAAELSAFPTSTLPVC